MLLFCAFFAMLPASVVFFGENGAAAYSSLISPSAFPVKRDLPVYAEGIIKLELPFRQTLLKLGRDLKLRAGQREFTGQDYMKQRGIFVGGGSLLKNISPPVDEHVLENISSVVEFAESVRQNRKQTYVMLIPTSGAIMQRELPRYAQSTMVNQRGFIEDIYGRVSGHVTTIDAYSALIARQNQYIYYRTENNLTAFGGYYIYAAMLPRLAMGSAELNQFDIEYLEGPFYGDLYSQSGYADVLPDTLSLFKYSASNRIPHEFMVRQISGDSSKTYHTLFPGHAPDLGGRLDIYLGGLSAVTDINTSSQHSVKILLFGDKTAISYLPFLANDIKRVTYVDLSCDYEEFDGVDPLDYDKVIFAYSVESFMHTNIPSRAISFLEDYNQWYKS